MRRTRGRSWLYLGLGAAAGLAATLWVGAAYVRLLRLEAALDLARGAADSASRAREALVVNLLEANAAFHWLEPAAVEPLSAAVERAAATGLPSVGEDDVRPFLAAQAALGEALAEFERGLAAIRASRAVAEPLEARVGRATVELETALSSFTRERERFHAGLGTFPTSVAAWLGAGRGTLAWRAGLVRARGRSEAPHSP